MTARVTTTITANDPGRIEYRILGFTRSEVQAEVSRLMMEAEDAGTGYASFTPPHPHRYGPGFYAEGFVVVAHEEQAA